MSAESAQAELNVIAERLAAQYPEDKGYGAQFVTMSHSAADSFATSVLSAPDSSRMKLRQRSTSRESR